MERERWERLEIDCARAIGGKRTPGSGSKGMKGDIHSANFIIECKYRSAINSKDGAFFPLEIEWLECIYRQAEIVKKVPVLVIEWEDYSRACLLSSDKYEELIDPFPFYTTLTTNKRYIQLESKVYTNTVWNFVFTKMEISVRDWVLFPFADLSYLRLSETKEKKRLTTKLIPPRFAKKKFPGRRR